MRSKTAMAVMGAYILAAAPMARAAEHQFSGDVSRLDATAKTLVVKEDGAKSPKEMTFSLATDAKIMQGAKARSFADLKVGERVKVSYADAGSAHQAKRIDVLGTQTAHAASQPKKAPSGALN